MKAISKHIQRLFLLVSLSACSHTEAIKNQNSVKSYSLRLRPGQDLRRELEDLFKAQHWPSATIISAVGSLRELRLRRAGSDEILQKSGPHEIVSLVGTLSENGPHLHLAAADSTGGTWGGHLVLGNIIYTTCEITLLIDSRWQFRRVRDEATGYQELEPQAISE